MQMSALFFLFTSLLVPNLGILGTFVQQKKIWNENEDENSVYHQ